MSSPAPPRERTATRPALSARPRPPAVERTAVRHDGVPSTAPPPAARYRYDRGTGAWWWSPEMFAVLGRCPDDTQPGTEVLLRQQHPEDRARVRAALTAACDENRPFALETRVLRPDGSRRAVVLVGEPSLGRDGSVVAVDGMCVDITAGRPPSTDRMQQLEAEVEQLRSAMASRAAIEQAKGILMLLTSCGDQAAFDLLAHISSHTHRKVRDVAVAITTSAAGGSRLPDDVRGIIRDACPPARLR